jgi:hypothetical protein
MMRDKSPLERIAIGGYAYAASELPVNGLALRNAISLHGPVCSRGAYPQTLQKLAVALEVSPADLVEGRVDE